MKFIAHGYDLSRHYSHKFLQQTPEKFYSDLEASAATVGTKPVEVVAAINNYENSQKDEVACKELADVLLPIFLTMRKKGYYSADLV